MCTSPFTIYCTSPSCRGPVPETNGKPRFCSSSCGAQYEQEQQGSVVASSSSSRLEGSRRSGASSVFDRWGSEPSCGHCHHHHHRPAFADPHWRNDGWEQEPWGRTSWGYTPEDYWHMESSRRPGMYDGTASGSQRDSRGFDESLSSMSSRRPNRAPSARINREPGISYHGIDDYRRNRHREGDGYQPHVPERRRRRSEQPWTRSGTHDWNRWLP